MSQSDFSAQPRANEPIVGRDGLVTRAWRDYFARLAMAQSSDDLRQLYEALAARVAELAEGQSLRIVGRNSVSTAGTAVVEIQLVGDEAAPGNTEYYGTGPTGQRGFFPIASAIAVDPGELEKSIGSDGVITLGLVDLPDSGGGALKKIVRDSKGRVAGTSNPTTDDLSQGAINHYWKEAPVDGKQYARKDADWQEVDAISIQFPFYLSSGAFEPIPLTASKELPFFLSNGTQANIPMVTA